MKFAHVLGWINTRIILTLVYFLIISPIALIFKVIGKDPMNLKYEETETYWKKAEEKEFVKERYRRQF